MQSWWPSTAFPRANWITKAIDQAQIRNLVRACTLNCWSSMRPQESDSKPPPPPWRWRRQPNRRSLQLAYLIPFRSGESSHGASSFSCAAATAMTAWETSHQYPQLRIYTFFILTERLELDNIPNIYYCINPRIHVPLSANP